MTNAEFSKLHPWQQEDFLNDGGIVDSSVAPSEGSHSPELVCVSDGLLLSPSVEPKKEQAEQVTGMSSQPVSSPTNELWQNGFDIEDPVELLFMLDDNIASGRVILHEWQVKIMLDFAKGGESDKRPFQSVVRACNGSGKDKYVIAPCVVWLSMRFKGTISPVTSSSGVQLDNQTCRYIKQLTEAVNRKFQHEIWHNKYRHYTCDFGDGTKSEIFCYATDEAGKAEGYHPTDFGCKMGIFVSEDKTVADDINVALNKCTGYTHRLHVSTPGLPMGHFFDYCSSSIMRQNIEDIKEVTETDWIQYHVTAYDCSHISRAYIEQMKRDLPGGEFGSAFKSQVLAEFGTTDEMVVIPYIYVSRGINNKIAWKQEPFNKAGLDLSDGGAETVLLVRNGNKHLKTIPFRFDNTQDTLDFLEDQFEKNDLKNKDALIYADCCGIGKPMLDSLKRRGWSNIRYVDSRHAASQPKVFKNRGTELFFHVRQLMERGELIILRDDILIRQLSTRYYKMVEGVIHQLLTKLEQRSRGYPSPDRADAFNLAFWDYQSTSTTEEEKEPPFEKEESVKIINDFDLKEWAYGKRPSFYSITHVPTDDLREQLNEINKGIYVSNNK